MIKKPSRFQQETAPRECGGGAGARGGVSKKWEEKKCGALDGSTLAGGKSLKEIQSKKSKKHRQKRREEKSRAMNHKRKEYRLIRGFSGEFSAVKTD